MRFFDFVAGWVSCRQSRCSAAAVVDGVVAPTNLLSVTVLTCLALASPGVSAIGIYQIGNSLTWDEQPLGFAALASQAGHSVEIGYHIRAGQSLDYIAGHPDDYTPVTPTPFGPYVNALSGYSWDVITVQPYDYGGSTLATDLAAISKFLDLATAGPSGKPTVYIYEAWNGFRGGFTDTYQQYWNQPVSSSPDQPTVLAGAYFDLLYSSLTRHYGDRIDVAIIPVGDVLNRLDQDIHGGLFPGLNNVTDFYRDELHLGDAGRFVAGLTAYASIFQEDPSGLVRPEGYYANGLGGVALTPELVAQLESTVWDVVSHDPRTRALSPVPLPSGFGPMAAALCGLGFWSGGLRIRRCAKRVVRDSD